jgi:hypothetical protein
VGGWHLHALIFVIRENITAPPRFPLFFPALDLRPRLMQKSQFNSGLRQLAGAFGNCARRGMA